MILHECKVNKNVLKKIYESKRNVLKNDTKIVLENIVNHVKK